MFIFTFSPKFGKILTLLDNFDIFANFFLEVPEVLLGNNLHLDTFVLGLTFPCSKVFVELLIVLQF